MNIRTLTLCAGVLALVACTNKDTDGGETGDANTAPSAAEIAISPENPTSSDDLLAVLVTEATDPDGDALTYSYKWKFDGVDGESLDDRVPAVETVRDQEWTVTVTANDGLVDGEAATASVTIGNSPPVVASVSIIPDPADTSAPLSCDVGSVEDADGDPVDLFTTWTVDGEDAGSDDVLAPTSTYHEGEVQCTVTPDDGIDSGEPVASAPLVISNSPPTAPLVEIRGGSNDADLFCGVVAESNDLDAHPVTYTVRWEVDEVSHTGTTATVTWPDDTVPADQTAPDQTWTCHATPNDGFDDGAEGASAPVVIAPDPVTFTIARSMLDGLDNSCDTADERPYNDCSSDWGFTWTDTGDRAPASVTIDLGLGVSCSTTTQDVSLNGTLTGSFAHPGTCYCEDELATETVVASDISSYVVGGTNSIVVTTAGSCEGLMNNPDWGADAYAQVTVAY